MEKFGKKESFIDKFDNYLIIGGVIGAAAFSAPIILGFGTAGIVGGSIAAGIQSGIGNVVAGSLFANMTSLGMEGVFIAGAKYSFLGALTGGITKLFSKNKDFNVENKGGDGKIRNHKDCYGENKKRCKKGPWEYDNRKKEKSLWEKIKGVLGVSNPDKTEKSKNNCVVLEFFSGLYNRKNGEDKKNDDRKKKKSLWDKIKGIFGVSNPGKTEKSKDNCVILEFFSGLYNRKNGEYKQNYESKKEQSFWDKIKGVSKVSNPSKERKDENKAAKFFSRIFSKKEENIDSYASKKEEKGLKSFFSKF